MDGQNKPTARKKRVVGEGKGIEKKGEGLGTGPVGQSEHMPPQSVFTSQQNAQRPVQNQQRPAQNQQRPSQNFWTEQSECTAPFTKFCRTEQPEFTEFDTVFFRS